MMRPIMRPMKLAGSELMFGKGCLEYIKSMPYKKVSVVIGGSSMVKSGMLDKICGYFKESGAETMVISGVEPDPHFTTVMKGAKQMQDFGPDLVVGLGGGSAMDAAKAMWIYYEHPELTKLSDIFPPNTFPKLRAKARFCCIPSTSGTASEVSRSFVLTDENGIKQGLGNMEMMPDIAICDPEVTASMPPKITAETGMDAMTHALEAVVSKRVNYVADILARKAVIDIHDNLPKAYRNGKDMDAREIMVNASMIAGMAFTNVSLGIVHSMAHTIGSLFHVSHGLADAVILPYVIDYNSRDERAKAIYESIAAEFGEKDMAEVIRSMNKTLNIPDTISKVVEDKEAYMEKLEEMAKIALADGCTKTNPIIPDIPQMEELFKVVYTGK